MPAVAICYTINSSISVAEESVSMGERYCIAGDIGGTNIRVSLVDSKYRILSKLKEPTGPEPLSVLFSLIDRIILTVPAGRQICGIGLAVAGIVDAGSGVVLRSPNMPALLGLNPETKSPNGTEYGPLSKTMQTRRPLGKKLQAPAKSSAVL